MGEQVNELINEGRNVLINIWLFSAWTQATSDDSRVQAINFSLQCVKLQNVIVLLQ